MLGSLQHELSAGELEELTNQIRLMTDAQLDDAIKELRRAVVDGLGVFDLVYAANRV